MKIPKHHMVLLITQNTYIHILKYPQRQSLLFCFFEAKRVILLHMIIGKNQNALV